MTYQTNIHIKEEPSSPPSTDHLGNSATSTTSTTTSTTKIEPHHFSGSVLTYSMNPQGGLAFGGSHNGVTQGSLFPGQRTPITPPYDIGGADYKWPIVGSEMPATPKSCLKETILSRRRARGEGELENLFEEPKQYKLTKADMERRERRREQNRRAARRCRNKKKIVQTIVCKESEKINKENEQLHQEITELKEEICRLNNFIENHSKVCQCPETFNILGLFGSEVVLQEVTATPASTHTVTDAISDAHQTLGEDAVSFSQPTSISNSSQDMGVSCNSYTSISSGLSEKPNVNLPSWDLMNLISDLPQGTYLNELSAFTQNSAPTEGYAHNQVKNTHLPFSCVTSHEMAEMTCVDPNLIQEQQKTSSQLPPFHSILPGSQTCSPGQTVLPSSYSIYSAIPAVSSGQTSRLVCSVQPPGFQTNPEIEYTCIDPYGQVQENYSNYFSNPAEFSKRGTM